MTNSVLGVASLNKGARGRRLRIGLSANIYQPDFSRMAYKGRRLLYLEEGMAHWLMRAGATAFLLPTAPLDGGSTGAGLADLVAELDGVVMTGGADMAPESYGETALRPEWAGDKHRDEYELALVHAALAQDKPLLGICRGHQVLNVALGGTLYQDIRTQVPGALHHRIFDVYEGNHHGLRLTEGGLLARLYGGTDAGGAVINSVHHQGVKQLGPKLVCEAQSPTDGIVEALRLQDASGAYLVGVQWHPELQDTADKSLLSPRPLLDDFLQAVTTRKR